MEEDRIDEDYELRMQEFEAEARIEQLIEKQEKENKDEDNK